MPVPFSVRAMCDLVAAERGRPIRLMAMSGVSEVCGVWIATETMDLICYEEATTSPHQEHIILHELSHLLCDHYPASLDEADHARLLPDLDPEMVRRVLGRTSYSTVEEQEAELLASLIRQRAHLGEGSRKTAHGGESSGLVRRLHAALVWHRPGVGGPHG